MPRDKHLVALLSSLLLAACSTGSGGGGDDDDNSVDSGIMLFTDANTSGGADANHSGGADANTTVHPDAGGSWSCTVPQNNSGPSDVAGQYVCADTGGNPTSCGSTDPSAAALVYFAGAVNDDTLPDVLFVELYAGGTAFPDGLATGTYNLASEGDYSACGACITVATDYDDSGSSATWTDDYYQTGGTITITGFTDGNPGTVTGSVSGLTLTHVTIDSSTYASTPVGDGCDINVANFSFTASVSNYGS